MFFRSIIKIMLLPIISIVVFVGFFTIFLTPQQRSSLFNEALSRLPVFNNFVDRSFNTRVFGLKLEDFSELKTATWAVNQLVLLENRAGKKYYAVNPFVLEAGFDLSKTKTSLDGEVLTLSLPAARILSNDTDEKRGLVVIRDDLRDKYGKFLQPLKMAYSHKAYDLALSNGLLKAAEKNAKAFLRDFWKPVYKDVKVEIARQDGSEFTDFNCERLPFGFRIGKTAANLSKHEYPELESQVGYLEDDKGTKYDIFFIDDFSGSRDDLKKKFMALCNRIDCFITYNDPINPRDVSWVGGINNFGSFFGVYQVSGELYGLYCSAIDENSSMFSKSRAIYLLSSVQKNTLSDTEKCERYREFVQIKNRAIEAFKQKQFNSFYSQAQKLHAMDPNSTDGKYFYHVAQGINDGTFITTGFDDTDCLLKGWIAAHHGKFAYLDIEIRKQLGDYFDKNDKKALDTFYKYLLEEKDRLKLEESEIDETENYLIENHILSRKLLANLGKSKLRNLLNGWICNKVRLLEKRYGNSKKFHAKGLFCDLYCDGNGESVRTRRKNTPYPFFDYYALEHLHAKGKSTVYNQLPGYSPQDHTVIVVSHEGFILDSYDAFILESSGLTVIRGFQNGFDSDDVTWMNYSDLNPGYDQITIAGKEYKNATLFYLLNKLSEIYSEDLLGGVGRQFEELLLEKIICAANNVTWTGVKLDQTLGN